MRVHPSAFPLKIKEDYEKEFIHGSCVAAEICACLPSPPAMTMKKIKT